MLKVISGKYKGRNIKFPQNDDVRPTSSVVKEALFNIIQLKIVNARFLDLFFGSGQIGIEALSRGANYVKFVDKSKYCKDCLIKNLKQMNINDNFDIINLDAILYLSGCKEMFDIIFLDPPYNRNISDAILKLVIKNVKKEGVIIVETSKIELLDQRYSDFEIYKEYIYGKKKLTLYKCENKNT